MLKIFEMNHLILTLSIHLNSSGWITLSFFFLMNYHWHIAWLNYWIFKESLIFFIITIMFYYALVIVSIEAFASDPSSVLSMSWSPHLAHINLQNLVSEISISNAILFWLQMETFSEMRSPSQFRNLYCSNTIYWIDTKNCDSGIAECWCVDIIWNKLEKRK